MSEQEQIFKYIESIAEIVPCPFYWGGTDFKFAGANSLGVSAISAPNKEYLIGKTVYELYRNQEIAKEMQKHIEKVIQTGEVSRREDKVIDVATGKFRYYMATRVPLRDYSGKIIGFIGTSIESTLEKEEQQSSEHVQIFAALKDLAEKMPTNVYWLNLNYQLIGVNQKTLDAIGASSQDQVIGKTAYEIYPQEVAEELSLHFIEVTRTLTDIKKEHTIIDIETKNSRTYYDVISPIFDNSKVLIGIVGASIEITAEKEAEELRVKNKQHELENQLLKLENEKYQIEKKAQEKLIQFVDNISNMIQRFKLDTVNKKLGLTNNSIAKSEKVTLTRREEQVLYFIAMGKSPKEIATILGKFENKIISDATIGGMINKQLYPKLGVASYGQLIDKATSLGLIHFIPDSLKDFFMV